MRGICKVAVPDRRGYPRGRFRLRGKSLAAGVRGLLLGHKAGGIVDEEPRGSMPPAN